MGSARARVATESQAASRACTDLVQTPKSSELMAVPVSDPDDRSPAAPTRPSLIQIAASALAAVSAAVIASLFGVAGTMIGAAVASVVSTVGVALYSESLHRTHAGIRRAGRQLARLPMLGAPEDRFVATSGMPLLPDHLNPRRGPARRRWLRWSTMAATVVAVFATAMGVVTVVELIGQQPVAALVGGSSQSGTTTIGSLSTGIGGGGKSPVTPAPSTASGSSSAGSPPTPPARPPLAPASQPPVDYSERNSLSHPVRVSQRDGLPGPAIRANLVGRSTSDPRSSAVRTRLVGVRAAITRATRSGHGIQDRCDDPLT